MKYLQNYLTSRAEHKQLLIKLDRLENKLFLVRAAHGGRYEN